VSTIDRRPENPAVDPSWSRGPFFAIAKGGNTIGVGGGIISDGNGISVFGGAGSIHGDPGVTSDLTGSGLSLGLSLGIIEAGIVVDFDRLGPK
jgi:hypothetical protein